MLYDDGNDPRIFQEQERYRNFEDEEGKKILEKCKSHVSRYKTPMTGDNAVILIHPLFFDLYHREELQSYPNLIAEADKYMTNLFRLFESQRDRSKTSLLVFENPKDYFEGTHDLLERELVDEVLFTRIIGGGPINYDYGRVVNFKSFFFGGLYNGLCFSQFIGGLGRRVPHERIHAIRELILEPRHEPVGLREALGVDSHESKVRSTLVPTKIQGGIDPSEDVDLKVVSLEEVLKEFI